MSKQFCFLNLTLHNNVFSFGIIFTNGKTWKEHKLIFASVARDCNYITDKTERAVFATWADFQEIFLNFNTVNINDLQFVLTKMLVFAFSSPELLERVKHLWLNDAVKVFQDVRLTGVQFSEFALWYRFPFLNYFFPK